MRFCGLGPGDAVPDANTLWDFREALIAAGALERLFARLDRAITRSGLSADGGPDRRRDPGGGAAPAQHRGGEGGDQGGQAGRRDLAGQACQGAAEGRRRALDGEVRQGRPAADGKPQIDIAIPTFGYKSHISIDRRHGIIRRGRSPTPRPMTGRGCARG